MDGTDAGKVDGWTGPANPVVNEMLLHDVYELPLEALRGALSLCDPAFEPDDEKRCN